MAKTLDSQPVEIQPLWQHAAGLLLALADAIWAAAWFRLGTDHLHPSGELEAGMALAATLTLAYLSTVLLDRLRILENVQRAVWGLLFLAGLWLQAGVLDLGLGEVLGRIVRLEALGLLLLALNLFLWRRAITLARDWFGPIAAWGRLKLGIWMLFIYVFVAGRLRPQTLGSGPLFAYLSTALLAMAVARISFIRQYHGAQNNPFDRRWAASLLGTALGVAGLATLISGLLTGQLSRLLAQAGEGLGAAVRAVLYIIGLPFLLLIYLLEPLIARLSGELARASQAVPTESAQYTPGGMPDPLSELIGAQVAGAGPPPWLVPALAWAIILTAVLLIWRQSRKRSHWRQRKGVGTDFLRAEGSLMGSLRAWAQESAGGLSQRLRGGQRQRAAARIRQIYAGLMDLTAELERPRPPAQTPLEFLPALRSLFPAQAGEVQEITAAYLKVRYGELPETRAEIEAVESAWKRVEQSGKRMKSSGQD